jgi:hypothetical protein
MVHFKKVTKVTVSGNIALRHSLFFFHVTLYPILITQFLLLNSYYFQLIYIDNFVFKKITNSGAKYLKNEFFVNPQSRGDIEN